MDNYEINSGKTLANERMEGGMSEGINKGTDSFRLGLYGREGPEWDYQKLQDSKTLSTKKKKINQTEQN